MSIGQPLEDDMVDRADSNRAEPAGTTVPAVRIGFARTDSARTVTTAARSVRSVRPAAVRSARRTAVRSVRGTTPKTAAPAPARSRRTFRNSDKPWHHFPTLSRNICKTSLSHPFKNYAFPHFLPL